MIKIRNNEEIFNRWMGLYYDLNTLEMKIRACAGLVQNECDVSENDVDHFCESLDKLVYSVNRLRDDVKSAGVTTLKFISDCEKIK